MFQTFFSEAYRTSMGWEVGSVKTALWVMCYLGFLKFFSLIKIDALVYMGTTQIIT